MARRWVVNASPLIILGKINHLPLLLQLTESLVVPAGVAHEIELGPASDPARQWLSGVGKDQVREVGELDPLIARWDLGRGESHVLTWARRHPGCEAVIDDLAARKCAAGLSIPVRGTLGIILLAKQEGYLPEVGPVLDRIQEISLHAPSPLAPASSSTWTLPVSLFLGRPSRWSYALFAPLRPAAVGFRLPTRGPPLPAARDF